MARPVYYYEPFPGSRGDEFGNMASYRKHPHRGSDWSGNAGKDIKAITNGRVKRVFWTDVLGWCLIQSTPDGHFILYAHMANKPVHAPATLLVGGQSVVGQVGNTGTATTGAHLHVGFGIHPMPHLSNYSDLRDLFKHLDTHRDPAVPIAAPKKAAPKPAAKKPAAKK
jgi:murein DD-endopeptidase MepM/ murein hydrolase activator NlpD